MTTQLNLFEKENTMTKEAASATLAIDAMKAVHKTLARHNASINLLHEISKSIIMAEGEFATKKVAKVTRPYHRPVVVEGIRFRSVSDGARYLSGKRSQYQTKKEYTLAVKRNISAIRRTCELKSTSNYHWA